MLWSGEWRSTQDDDAGGRDLLDPGGLGEGLPGEGHAQQRRRRGDADGEGPSESVTIGNPDFNYISLRGNAVLRWEYMPGATIFFVWTQSREDVHSDGNFYFRKSLNTLLNIKPDNIFMIKLTYRL